MGVNVSHIQEVFSRTIAFCRTSRWESLPPPELLVEHLSQYRILVTGCAEVLKTPAGQQAAACLVNLLARFCPAIDVAIPNTIKVCPGRRYGGTFNRRLVTELESIAPSIWAQRSPISGNQVAPNLVVSIGPLSKPTGVPTVQVSFGRWWGAIVEGARMLDPITTTDRAIGPLVGACLAATAVFKAAMRNFAATNSAFTNLHTEWDFKPSSPCLSLLDYSLSPHDSEVVFTQRLRMPIVFVSGGAISSATAYGLSSMELGVAGGAIYDPKRIDAPDLNRYLTATAADIGRPKAQSLSNWLDGAGAIQTCDTRFDGRAHLDQSWSDATYVVGVDDIPSRWTAQECWPEALLIGATDHDRFRVSQHRRSWDALGCAKCVDPFDVPLEPGQVLPTISFVSALAGFGLAAELIKLSTPGLTKYSLLNVADGRLLQLGKYNWDVTSADRDPNCSICGGGNVRSKARSSARLFK